MRTIKAHTAALAIMMMALTACGGGGSSDSASTAGAAPSSLAPSSVPGPASTAGSSTTSDPGTGVSAGPTSAAGWTADSDLVVNTASSADAQVMPAVARLQGGGHVVVWSAAAGDSVMLRRYDVHGTPTAAESVLDGGNAGVHPTVLALPDGGFAVAWFQFPGFVPGVNGVDSGVVKAMVQRFDASGTPTTPATLAGTTWGKRYIGPDPTRAEPLRPMLVPIARGGLAVVWTGAADASSATQMNAALFDVQGGSSGQKTLALPFGTAVAPLSDGGFLTAGYDTRYSGGGPVTAQRYDEKANAVGAPVLLGGDARSAASPVSSFVLKDGSPALLYSRVDPISGPIQQVHDSLVTLSATDASPLRSASVGDRVLWPLASAQLQGAALDDGGFVVMSALFKPGVQPPQTQVLVQRFDASSQVTGQQTFDSAQVGGSAQPVYVSAGIAGAVDNSVLVVTRSLDPRGTTNVVALHR